MTVKRIDNVGIVVEDIDAAIAFFTELGLNLDEIVSICFGSQRTSCRSTYEEVSECQQEQKLDVCGSRINSPRSLTRAGDRKFNENIAEAVKYPAGSSEPRGLSSGA